MRIHDSIEIIDLGLYFDNQMAFSDFHLGYEESMNKQGILMPRVQFNAILERLEKIFNALGDRRLSKIIINGDLKHEFGAISQEEWRNTLKLLDYLLSKCPDIIIVRGNHDTMLGPIAAKRGIRTVGHHIMGNMLFMHGDKLPGRTLMAKADIVIIGHEHPAVSIRDCARTELYKCFLKGKYNGKMVIAMPSFNLINEGTDVLRESLLSPFLKDIADFEVYVVADKTYNFGKIKSLV